MPAAPQHYSWHVRALSVPGPDTDLSLFVAFDSVRYLFGSGEGTQRVFVQKKSSTKGLAGVFVPDGGSKGRGGLPGVIMTASDSGIAKLDVVGPPDVTQYLATLRSSVVRNALNLTTHPHPPACAPGESEDIYDAPFMNVKSIALYPDNVCASPRQPYHRQQSAHQMAQEFVEDMFHNSKQARSNVLRQMPVPREKESSAQMVYICKAPPVPGKFNNEKAKALKIPEGPLKGQLVKGKAIEFDDPENPGTIKRVEPEEVVGGGYDGTIMAVVNCSADTLPSLLQSDAFEEYQPAHAPEGSESKKIHFMVHRVPTAVWQDKSFQEWMASFGPDTQHAIASTDGYDNDIAFTSTAWNVLQLSLIDGDFFSIPHATTPSPPDTSSLPPNATILRPEHTIKLNPPGKLELHEPRNRDVPFPTTLEATHAARRQIMKDMPEFAVECAKAREAVRKDARWDAPMTEIGDDIVVTTLGTGSAIPSKYRNVSSTLLDIPGVGGIMLDCGEGTLGQLRRKYGPEGIKKVYEDLRMIFVSHMHADHHLGLHAILEDRFAHGITSKLYLVAPLQIAISLAEAGPWSLGVSQEALDNIIWIDNVHLHRGFLPGIESTSPSPEEGQDPIDQVMAEEVPTSELFTNGSRRWPSVDCMSRVYGQKYTLEAVEEMKRDLGLSGFRVPRVQHRGRAWGLIAHHESGWKIAYSGDTKPCASFAHDGQGATLLIHEATLEDEEADMAAEKGHSTFSQAIEVGRKMEASHILLNHFSQRYPKLPKSKVAEGGDGDGVVSISYDMMSIRVGEMWKMAYYMDAAEILFKSDPDEEDERVVGAVVGAVVGDANPTVGAKKGGKAAKAGKAGKEARVKAEKDKSGAKPAQAKSAKHEAKRAVSPQSVESEAKRPRSEEGA